MLIRESTLRKLIQEVLLLEAIYKQKDLFMILVINLNFQSLN